MSKSKSKSKAHSKSDATADSAARPAADSQEASTDKNAAKAKQTDRQDGTADPAQQLSDAESKWLRARADLDNARRRARLDVEEARAYSATALLQSLLPVLDALQRALSSAPASDSDDPILEGLRLTEQQFRDVLAAHGVQPVPAEPGSPCDPSIHRVLIEQPSDEFAPGQIVSEITKGYTLHDRLLREAQVAVAAKEGKPSPATTTDSVQAPEGELPDADL